MAGFHDNGIFCPYILSHFGCHFRFEHLFLTPDSKIPQLCICENNSVKSFVIYGMTH